MKDFSFSCRRLLPQNIERIREPLNYVDIIEKNIYNIDSKICGIIDDYKVLRDSQKVADYVIQFLRTYLETIAARIYAYENPDKPTPIRGKDKWYTQYIKALKETNEYGYIWMFHHSLQIVTSHYVPAEDGAVRFMEGHINLLYQLRNHMREMFGLNLMENLEDYPQEKNEELNPYYRKIYNSLREIQVEESAEHTKDRYYIMRKKYRFVDGRGFFEYTLAYAQEEITKFDRFVVYSFSDIPDNYSIQCDFAHTSVDFNGIDIDIKCLVAWTVSIRPCELEKIAAIAGYEVTVRSYNTFYRAMMKFLSKKGMNLLDILLADENDYDIYSEQVQIGQTSKFAEVFNKLRDIIINDKSGCNIIRYLISFLRNDVIRDQLADCPNNRFPLKLSSVRNVLISQGFLCVDRGVTGSRFYVSPEYESLVASQCIRKRKAISLEQLKKRLKSDELAGEKAELFVVKYEKKRLGVEGENKVKRISEIDVTAGYDIVSANSPNSTVANRFIEVKAVSENGFYWSKNEYDIAKLLAADYYLYLVDLSKIDDDNYEPDIIHNPVQHIMENNLWLVEPQSYHIQKVKF